MNTLSKLLDSISFESALEKNSLHHIYETLNGTGKEIFPRTLKIFGFASISLLVCLFSGYNWYVFPILASIIIIGICIGYFRSSLYFKNAAYTFSVYLFAQTTLIFYITSIEISDSTMINRVAACLYIFFGYCLSLYITKIKLIENVQSKYLANDGKLGKKKGTIKAVKILSAILVSFIVIVIAGTQFYRVNKWWMDGSNPDALSGLNGTFAGTILSAILMIIGVAILIIITLLPTLLLNTAAVVDGYIYKKYAEEFRKEYEFTEKEWYGE
ncbi:hypothetical protein JR552_002572 [Listeria monocytogenes serotype 1/2b]|nr:hypothetical protein [Listeria monocytogenes]EHC6177825.1 hypothetical protein [Listeria monocytogenes serotype 1/2b]EEP7701337.1 hypothetical protein [Listeria monocytogenes]EHC6200134.1 hypothetical protein [Listeria monocytogenes serotype 1/2b]EHC6234850.1 hypothetical protein [Listeria monocytogenes serotype 1/2b]